MSEECMEIILIGAAYAFVIFVSGFTNWIFYQHNKKSTEEIKDRYDASMRTDKRKIIIDLYNQAYQQKFLTPSQERLLISAYRDYAGANGNSEIEAVYNWCMELPVHDGIIPLPEEAKKILDGIRKDDGL